ncbi:MAG: GNAT family N-acetyltransferase [Delftia acidovorans]|jgi:RimJ/RimL family protein N-acetyltransferase|nr:GNAT family N-acetyltransferase [Delftia acidovorans]
MTDTPPFAVTIRTPHLLLRQWQPRDLAPFAALNADAEVMRHFPAPLTQAQSDAMAGGIREEIEERGWGPWAAEYLATGEFIGFIGLHVPTAALPFQPCVEIAWRLARSFWGQGLASEGALAALGHGFGVLGLESIVSFTALPNLRSQAVMQRLGMLRDVHDFDHPALPEGHPLRRHCLYRMTHAQWLQRQAPDKHGQA